jgi:hemerythrin HHE cation binding domain-containing protein
MTTITATQAYEAMLEHHKRLGEELSGRTDAVSSAVAAGRPYGTAVADLIAYLAEEVLPHAAAEEKTIYPASSAALAGSGMVPAIRLVSISASSR